MDFQTFYQMLRRLSEEKNNETRYVLEYDYFKYRTMDPSDNFVDNIIQSIIANNDLTEFSCVLLRQDMEKNGGNAAMYRLADVSKGTQYIDALLQFIAVTKNDKALMVVSQWACDLMERGVSTPNVFGFIQQAYENENVRSLSLRLVAEMINQRADQAKLWPFNAFMFLEQALQDANHEVARYSIQAIAKILMDNNTETGLSQQVVLQQVQHIIQRIAATLTQQDEKNAVKMLVSLQDIISFIGDEIRDIIPQIITLLTQIMQSYFSEELKCQAIRIFIGITESVSNLRKYLADIVSRFLRDYILPNTSYVVEKDIMDWTQQEEDLEYRSDSIQALCEDCFEQASYTLGKQIVMPLLLQSLQLASKHPYDWHLLLCCMNAICFAAEGLSEVIKQKEVDYFCYAILANQTNPNPRVRYIVLQTIGYLSTDFQPQMQKNHKTVMQCIMNLVQDPCQRVAFHSVAAAINFNSGLVYEQTYLYLQQFIYIMRFAWNSGKMEGQTNALTLLASLCEILDKEDLAQILYEMMPQILQQFYVTMDAIRNVKEFTKRYQEFISAIVQAISMSVEVVPELFHGLADQIMNALIMIVQRSYQQEEGDQFEEAFNAIERVSATLPPENMPVYINQLYPMIMKIISSKMINVSQDIVKEGDVEFSEHVIKLQTAVFLSMVSFLDKFPQAFAPYFDELTTAVLNFNSLAMPSLEVARLQCLAQFVNVAYQCGKNVAAYHAELFPKFMKEVVPIEATSIVNLYDLDYVQDCCDACATYIESYLKYVKQSGDKSAYDATVEQFAQSVEFLRNKAQILFEDEMKNLQSAEDFDEEELDAEQQRTFESYESTISSISYCYSAFTIAMEDQQLIEQRVMPVIRQFASMGIIPPNSFYTNESFGLCSDIMETSCYRIAEQLLNDMVMQGLKILQEKLNDWCLAQQIFFFLGQYQKKFPQAQILLYKEIIEFAFHFMLEATEDGSEDAQRCRDNVCSFLLYVGDQSKQEDAFWSNWVKEAMKMTEDGDEVYDVLLHIVEQILSGAWAYKLALFVPLIVTLFFGKFYSDMKNSKEDKSVKLILQIKQLFYDQAVQQLVQQTVQSADSASPIIKNFYNFVQ